MNDPKVVMVMEPRQARVVVKALDNYGRMGMIQLDAAVGEFLRVHYWDPNANSAEEHHKWEEIERHIASIKRLLGQPTNGSLGIRGAPAVCREAYDIQQVIRKAIADNENLDGVWAHDYMPTHREWPKIQAFYRTRPEEPTEADLRG